MKLYSNKQKWKIALAVIALVLVGISLFESNLIVKRVGVNERDRARQWADAIKKKIELVRLTDHTFMQLRDKERKEMELWINATIELSKETPPDIIPDYTFPLKIINDNKDIPVILMDDHHKISGFINLDFDTSTIRNIYPELSHKQVAEKFDDSLIHLSASWSLLNKPFTVKVADGLLMTYFYTDTKELIQLEKERDSLINSFNHDLIDNEGLVPVLLVNADDNEVIGSNLPKEMLSEDKLAQTIQQLKQENEPIVIDLKNGTKNMLYYDDSPELKELQFYPYIYFFIITLFVLIAYLIFSTFRKAEQNQVWAGMAKETAHQLGTPLSSLMAWIQLLESQQVDPMITTEMQKDVERLNKVSDRFSKIGSLPKLSEESINKTVLNVVEYLRPRISSKITIELIEDSELQTLHNGPLMEWVIENISKNAVDAMESNGKLTFHLHGDSTRIYIDITDTGKGISPKQLKTIFEPGFSTKKRGWGLGLSLVKRIVESYHKGKVFVLESQVGSGTTFRISLPVRRTK